MRRQGSRPGTPEAVRDCGTGAVFSIRRARLRKINKVPSGLAATKARPRRLVITGIKDALAHCRIRIFPPTFLSESQIRLLGTEGALHIVEHMTLPSEFP